MPAPSLWAAILIALDAQSATHPHKVYHFRLPYSWSTVFDDQEDLQRRNSKGWVSHEARRVIRILSRVGTSAKSSDAASSLGTPYNTGAARAGRPRRGGEIFLSYHEASILSRSTFSSESLSELPDLRWYL